MTSRFPYPPVRGDKVRTYNFLRALATRHEVDLISFVGSEESLSNVSALSSLCSVETVAMSRARSLVNLGLGLLSRLPYQVIYYRSGEMHAKVRGALTGGHYDLVYTHLFRMAPFVLDGAGRPMRGAGNARVVVDLTDAISSELRLSLPRRKLHLKLPYRWEASKVRAYEAAVAPLFDEAWVISEADGTEIRRLAPGARVAVVPNGVDESLFSIEPTRSKRPVILFVGNLAIPHNVDALELLAREILPRVREALPDVSARVVGHSAGPDIQSLARACGLDLIGYVPALEDAYRGAAVFAAPLRFAAGVQNKILEAMASGLPVVTTSLGNQGLGAEDDREIFVRDDPAAFAETLIQVLKDGELGSAVGERARSFVRKNYRWDRVVERAEQLVVEPVL